MSGLLIAATDTGAGKTVLTCALAAYWQQYCQPHKLGLLKPLQSGYGDRELYTQLFELDYPPSLLNPIHFEAPLAPPVAATLAGQSIDLAPAWRAYQTLEQQCDWVLVEGIGGLGSPITPELTVADLAADWRLPVVLVVTVRLGAIAQAVANVALARQHRLDLRGIVLNCQQPVSSEDQSQLAPIPLLQSLTQTPILGTLQSFTDPTDTTQLAEAARSLSLDSLLPHAFWLGNSLLSTATP